MNCNNEISMYFNDIKGYVQSTLIYLNNKNNNLDKKEIIMYLSSIEEIINDIKEELINYLYYIEDKIDEAYKKEVYTSITSFIISLKDGDYSE